MSKNVLVRVELECGGSKMCVCNMEKEGDEQKGVVWCDRGWRDVEQYSIVQYGMVWYGMVWCGVVWYGMVWCGVVWCDVVCSCGW